MLNKIEIQPIGFIISDCKEPSKTHSESVSRPKIKATIKILPAFKEGIKSIKPGQQLMVIFNLHKAKIYKLTVTTHSGEKLGIFSTHSPNRPNSLGLSTVGVLAINDDEILIDGSDMIDGTPIIDIKSAR